MQQCMELEEVSLKVLIGVDLVSFINFIRNKYFILFIQELKKSAMMKPQIDMYKRKVQELQSLLSDETKRADKADFEHRRVLEKKESIQQEKEVSLELKQGEE